MVQLKASLDAGCSHCTPDESVQQICHNTAGPGRDASQNVSLLPQQQWGSERGTCLEWNTHGCGVQQRRTDWNKRVNKRQGEQGEVMRRKGGVKTQDHQRPGTRKGGQEAVCGHAEGLRRAVVAAAHSSWDTTRFSEIFICPFKQSIWDFFLFSVTSMTQISLSWHSHDTILSRTVLICFIWYLPPASSVM